MELFGSPNREIEFRNFKYSAVKTATELETILTEICSIWTEGVLLL